jgi:hypothetical protein
LLLLSYQPLGTCGEGKRRECGKKSVSFHYHPPLITLYFRATPKTRPANRENSRLHFIPKRIF